MILNLLAVAVVALAHFSLELSDGGVSLLFPIIKDNLTISHALVATIMTVRIAGSSVLQPVFGIWVDMKPNRAFLPFGLLLMAAGIASLGYMPNYPSILFAAFLGGLGSAMFHPAASKAIYFNSGNKKASGLAIFLVTGNLGYALGPALMTLLLFVGGLRGTIYILFLGILTTTLLIYMMRKGNVAMPSSTNARETLKMGFKEMMSGSVIVLTIFTIMRAVVHLGFITYIPFYNPYGGASLALTLFLVAGALGTLMGGAMADRYGSRAVIFWSSMMVIPLSALFLLTNGVSSLIFLTLLGLTLVASASVTVVICQNLMPHGIGLASGLMIGFGYGAAGMALILYGLIADLMGVEMALWSLALTTIPTLLLGLIVVRPLRAKASEEPGQAV